ncbi:MAG: ATP-binding protein [Candidatus Cloacimonadaceae bacterium]|nr:ATP-binding protein [Candidatus Cloacimonadaceae bacterium]
MQDRFNYIKLLNNEIEKVFSDPSLTPDLVKEQVLTSVKSIYAEQDLVYEFLSDLYRIKNWEDAIQTVLAKAGAYLDVSRIFIMESVASTKDLILEHVWHHQDFPSAAGVTIPSKVSDHMFDYLLHHDYYYISSLSVLEADYAAYLKSLNIVSCLIFPIKMQNRIFGFIGIDECSRERIWTDEEVRFIHILSELVSHAILQIIAQKELSRSNEIMTNVLDSIHAIITVIDVETDIILYLNKYAENVLGNAVGKVCWSVLHGDLTGPCENCPRPGKGEYIDQTVVIKEIQNSYWKRWYHTTNTIIEWKQGQKAHLEIAIDITDRVETENQMKFTTQRLEDLNRTKDKFFSIVAHDLKNPLYSLMGFAEIIKNSNQQLSPEEITEYSDLIFQAARNTHQLLQNLMVWSQSQTGKLKYNPQQVDLNQLLDNAIEFMIPVARQKNINILRNYQTKKTIEIDPNMITAAVRNLMTNAVKFTPPDRTIHMHCYEDDPWVCICVEDEGIGLSEEDQGKLFRIDIDHRSIGRRYTDAKGTGLGLILVKEFVNLHKGKILVESTDGVGSKFTICLPL